MRNAVLSAVLLIYLALPAAALEIVYPADKTWVVRSNFLIVKGGGEPAPEAMIVTINGIASDPIDISSAEYKAAFADFLILEPEWDAGKNLVEVTALARGKEVARERADVFFLTGPGEVAPPGYRRFVMHLPEKETLCAPCHNMNPSKAEMNAPNPQKNPCASCHKRMLATSHVHGPAGVWSCTYCHPAETRPAKYQVREGDAKVCNECHADKVKQFRASKFVHGPIEAGICSACHDSHATDHTAQLYAPVNELCLGCHAIDAGSHAVRGVSGSGHPLKGPADPSRQGKPFTCASCHDPHGGAVPTYFAQGASSRFALCQMCHKK